MQTCTHQPISIEYLPLQTEMGNYNPEESDMSYNDNTIHYLQNKDQLEEEDNCALINSNRYYGSFDTLQSLRISRSVSGKKTNEKMLLQRMNNLNSDNEDEMQTPKKKQTTKIVIEALFDCSATNNKNIMVSELDIQISSNNKLKSNPYENRYPIHHLNTESTENKKNLLEDFNRKMQGLYPPNVIEAIAINYQSAKTEANKTPLASTTNTAATKSKFESKIPYNYIRISRCNKEIDIIKKNKNACYSIKKSSNITPIFDILKRIRDKPIISSYKSKNSGTVSYLSTAYQNTIPSNIHSSLSKKKNEISTEKPVKKPEIPFISSFKYNEAKCTYRPGSLKQKQSGIKEFDRLTTKVIRARNSNSKKDIFLKIADCNNNCINKAIRTSMISNSRSKSKKNSNLKDKDATSFNLNYSLFHAIHSITHNKTKNNLMNTISTKQNSTRTYFPFKIPFSSKEKKIELNKPIIQSKKKKMKIPNNYSRLNTEIDRTITALHSNALQSHRNSKAQFQTPINTKPHIQIYKHNIKHVMITPLITLKMKLMNNQMITKQMDAKANVSHVSNLQTEI